MKPGKLQGPSHKNGGILLEAEGGEYIIKKSSVKKIGKKNLDKINKEGKLPMEKGPDSKRRSRKIMKLAKKQNKLVNRKMAKAGKKAKAKGGSARDVYKAEQDARAKTRDKNIIHKHRAKKIKKLQKTAIDSGEYKKGGKVGTSVKTYSSGGYVEGK